MKALRKSLGGSKDNNHSSHISTPITSPTFSKATISLPPPTRVIRATSSFRSQAPQQLSFEKGDFFHVLRDIENQGLWYEAHNPATGTRGLVPRAMFEEFSKGNPTYVVLHGSLTAPRIQWQLILISLVYVVPVHPRSVHPGPHLPRYLRP
jgi:bud emergence protein 1